jgi:hypothetical protein
MKRTCLTLQTLCTLALMAGPAAAGEYENLSAGIARAAEARGMRHIALGDFKAHWEGGEEAAKAARRHLADALYENGAIGVMDMAVLEKLREPGQKWADARVTGELYPAGPGAILAVRAIDARTGAMLLKMQVELQKGGRYPQDLRDAPAGGARSCGDRLRTFQQAHLADISLRAKYWAIKMLAPEFSLEGAGAVPGEELRDYASAQKFYELINEYYRQDAPVVLDREETGKMKAILSKEAAILRECPEEKAAAARPQGIL